MLEVRILYTDPSERDLAAEVARRIREILEEYGEVRRSRWYANRRSGRRIYLRLTTKPSVKTVRRRMR